MWAQGEASDTPSEAGRRSREGLTELEGIELWVVWHQTEMLMLRCSWTQHQEAVLISSRTRKTEALAKARLTTGTAQ